MADLTQRIRAGRRSLAWKLTIGFLIVLGALLYFAQSFFFNQKQNQKKHWDPVRSDENQNIFKINSIQDLEIFLDMHPEDNEFMKILHRIYQIDVTSSRLRIPSVFKDTLGKIPKVDEQKVVQIRNRLTGESSNYNPHRANRPKNQDADPNYLPDLIQGTKEDCQFCKPEIYTAEEEWGRVRTNHTVSAANLYRMVGPYNGIIIPEQHNPLQLSYEELEDMFACARDWFVKIYQHNSHLVYPMLVWDFFPKSGASQIHPHMQVWLGEEYTGDFLTSYQAYKKYRHKYRGDYLEDLFYVHSIIGLGVQNGSVSVISPLHSHSDNELMIVSRLLDDTFIRMFYTAIKLYNEKMDIHCISIGISLPPVDPGVFYYPVVARIGARGDCSIVASDVSSLDLYSFYSINADPFKLMQKLKQVITV